MTNKKVTCEIDVVDKIRFDEHHLIIMPIKIKFKYIFSRCKYILF